MDRLLFPFDPDEDITAVYRQLVGAGLAEQDRGARQDAWATIADALTDLRDLAETLGLGAAALVAFDATLHDGGLTPPPAGHADAIASRRTRLRSPRGRRKTPAGGDGAPAGEWREGIAYAGRRLRPGV